MDHPFRGQGPLLFLLVPYLLGVFLGLAAGAAWPGVAALLVVLSLALLVFGRSAVGSASALVALCGVLFAARVPFAPPGAVRPLLGCEVVLLARVEEARRVEGGLGGLASDAAVRRLDGAASVRLGTVRFFVRNRDRPPPAPLAIRASGRLLPIRAAGNPGEFPRDLAALSGGLQYAFVTDASRAVFLAQSGPLGSRVADACVRLRGRTRAWLLRHAGGADGALYLLSLATGEVPPASHPMVTLLRRTGLAHLLAISGLNVAVFFVVQAWLVRCLLWSFRMRRGTPDLNRVSAFLALPACWGYVLLAGAPVPALRSAGMITAAVVLWQAMGVRGAGAAWTFLFCGTLAADPFQIFSPSFLLSYGATFFLIVSAGSSPREEKGGVARAAKRLALDGMSASAVAFLGTLPMSAALFGGVPAGAIAWNAIFVPILGTGGVLGAFAAVAGAVFSADFLGPPVWAAARALTWTLALLDRVSGSGWGYFPVPPAGVVAPFAATLCAASGAVALRSRGRAPWLAVLAAAAGFMGWIHLPYAALPRDGLEVVALNVGKGAAHVVSFPGGGCMVVDCGSGLHAGPGENVVARFLRKRGIRRIDVMVLTHPHEDHYGGAAALIGSFPVGEIWIPAGISPGQFGPAAAVAARVRPKSAGDRYRAGPVEVIVRSAGEDAAPRRAANERCLVLEIRSADLSVWLPGDVETGTSAWGALPGADRADRANRVLFLPHHGSPGANPAEWLRAAGPVAAISQNWNCYENENLLPSTRCFRLENGAVVVCAERGEVSVRQAGWPRMLRIIRRLAAEGPQEEDCPTVHPGRLDVETAHPDPGPGL